MGIEDIEDVLTLASLHPDILNGESLKNIFLIFHLSPKHLFSFNYFQIFYGI